MAWLSLRDVADLSALAASCPRQRDRQRRRCFVDPHRDSRRGDPRHPPLRRVRRRARGIAARFVTRSSNVLITVALRHRRRRARRAARETALTARRIALLTAPRGGRACCRCAGGCSGGSTASSSATATGSSRCSASSARSLERAGDPRDLLTRLAAAVRRRARRIVGADPPRRDRRRARRVARRGRGRRRGRADRGRATSSTPTRSSAASRSDRAIAGSTATPSASLLRTVAGQAAASVANVRLTARLAEQLDELTASRERLVAAQDDERRRLERDLHDGIQQDIVAQIAGLQARSEPAGAGSARVGRADGAAGPGPSRR